MKKSPTLVIGKALLFASLQFAIGSVEMSSKFSVKNFSQDQETLNNAVSALADYFIVSLIWTLGTALMFTANYGVLGLVASLISNGLIILWILASYMAAFRSVAKKYDLKVPGLFQKK